MNKPYEVYKESTQPDGTSTMYIFNDEGSRNWYPMDNFEPIEEGSFHPFAVYPTGTKAFLRMTNELERDIDDFYTGDI